MKIYLASKFENKEEVKKAQDFFRLKGHVIVGDWTNHTLDGMSKEKHARYLRDCAQEDLQAVARCDALILLDHENMAGAYVEFGIALALNKIIVVVGNIRDQIFNNLPLINKVNSLEEANDCL